MLSAKGFEYLLYVRELKSSLYIMRRAARLLNRISIVLCAQRLAGWLQKRIAVPWGAAVYLLLFGAAILGAVYGVSTLPPLDKRLAGLFLAAPPLLFEAFLLVGNPYRVERSAYAQIAVLRRRLRRLRQETTRISRRLYRHNRLFIACQKAFPCAFSYRQALPAPSPEEFLLSQKVLWLLLESKNLPSADEWLPVMERFCLSREKRNAAFLRQLSSNCAAGPGC